MIARIHLILHYTVNTPFVSGSLVSASVQERGLSYPCGDRLDEKIPDRTAFNGYD